MVQYPKAQDKCKNRIIWNVISSKCALSSKEILSRKRTFKAHLPFVLLITFRENIIISHFRQYLFMVKIHEIWNNWHQFWCQQHKHWKGQSGTRIMSVLISDVPPWLHSLWSGCQWDFISTATGNTHSHMSQSRILTRPGVSVEFCWAVFWWIWQCFLRLLPHLNPPIVLVIMHPGVVDSTDSKPLLVDAVTTPNGRNKFSIDCHVYWFFCCCKKHMWFLFRYT